MWHGSFSLGSVQDLKSHLKVGDLVKCVEGSCRGVDDGPGIVIQVDAYAPEKLSVHVQWADDDLWYEAEDLEVINESR